VARRTKEEAAITREQLLDAAERVFRERGVAGSTLAEVAAAAGVTRGAVYWHFRDKADLYAAMCERATLPLESMLHATSAARQGDPLAALRELALEALTRLARDSHAQAVFDLMFHECERAAELAPLAERRRRERCHALLKVESVLAQAVDAGQLPAGTDTSLAALTLHAYIHGIMHEWLLDPSAFDLAAVAPALIDAMLAGLRVSPPRIARVADASPGARGVPEGSPAGGA
jgi:TetR/AcrR family acrAB operon transcriptional repressor